MKHRASYALSCAAFLFGCSSMSETISIEYPDQNLPGRLPVVFAPGIISQPQFREGALSFSPDGIELFFTKVLDDNKLSIMTMRLQDGLWTSPKVWNQSDVGNNAEPFVTYSGNEIYFISNREAPNAKGSGRIWKSVSRDRQWTKPVQVMAPISTDKGIWFPTVSINNNIYFGAYLDSIGNHGKSDIYIKDLKKESAPIKNFSAPGVNTPHEEWDPYIAPDESYLLFESDRPGGYGAVDIYVSFQVNGEWKEPVNLGPTINTHAYEVAAKVSPDGKYIFFDRPMKNEQDIYWVSSSVLDSLRHKVIHKNVAP